MAFFIASKKDDDAGDTISPVNTAGAEIILTDPEGRLALLWSSELSQNPSLATLPDLRLFNDNPPSGKRAQAIANVHGEDVYAGLVLVRQLTPRAFSQLSTEPVLANPCSTFGSDQSTLCAVVAAAAARISELRNGPPLRMFAEERLAGKPDSGTDVRSIMRSRTYLFEELERLVRDRRMVFLVGGRYSYLQDFLSGFRDYLEVSKIGHVQVDFEPEVFTAIRNRFPGDSIYRELDSFLAAVAFKALEQLRRHAGVTKIGIFKPRMAGKPREFAPAYLQTADSHFNHWDCVKHFMEVIDQAVNEVSPRLNVTIFLPFKDIDKVINARTDERRQIWDGMDALQNQLSRDETSCPGLGVIFAANTLLHHKRMQQKVVQNALLRLPPLSREELSRLVAATFGQNLSSDCLNTLDRQTGGVPFFVSVVLKTSLALMQEDGSSRESNSVLMDACGIVRSLLSAESYRSAVDTRTPPETFEEIRDYGLQLVEILSRSNSTLNTSQLLTAWRLPLTQQGQTFGVDRGIDEQLEAWLDSGLVWTQASDEERGSSLRSLRDFPEFRFAPAGELPLELGHLIIKIVNGRLEAWQ